MLFTSCVDEERHRFPAEAVPVKSKRGLRLKQIDALISPHFLDISARSSKVDFAEPDPEQEAERGSYYYSPAITLQLWSIDDAKGLATSSSPLEWKDALALPIEEAEGG